MKRYEKLAEEYAKDKFGPGNAKADFMSGFEAARKDATEMFRKDLSNKLSSGDFEMLGEEEEPKPMPELVNGDLLVTNTERNGSFVLGVEHEGRGWQNSKSIDEVWRLKDRKQSLSGIRQRTYELIWERLEK